MKTIFAMLVLTFSVSSFAKNEALIKACKEPAAQIMKEAAEYIGEELDMETVRVDEVDARVLNPLKYVWFKANTVGTNEEFSVVMVKPLGKDCIVYTGPRISN